MEEHPGCPQALLWLVGDVERPTDTLWQKRCPGLVLQVSCSILGFIGWASISLDLTSYLCSRWLRAPDGRSSCSLWGKQSLKTRFWGRAWGHWRKSSPYPQPSKTPASPSQIQGVSSPFTHHHHVCSLFPFLQSLGLDGEGGGWRRKEGAGLAPTKAVADPLLCCRRSKPRSTRPGSGRASKEANQWRKHRYAARSPSPLLGGLRRLSSPPRAAPQGCRALTALFIFAGGCVADSAESSKPPGHLQAEGEVSASGHGDGFPARYGMRCNTCSGSGSVGHFPVPAAGKSVRRECSRRGEACVWDGCVTCEAVVPAEHG